MTANVSCLDLGADCKQTSRENHHESVAPFIDPRNTGPGGRLLPRERPPKLIVSKIVQGASEKPAGTSARLIQLYGRKSVVWDIAKPKPHQAFKLEWTW